MASTPTAFERIYGQATPTSPAQPSSTPMENKISASNAGAGAVALFDGPSHVLQAVESLYDPFMRALLSGPAQRTEQKHAIRRSLGGGTHLRKRKRDGDSAGADPDTTQVDSDVAMPSGGTSVETARDFAFAAEDERVFAMDTMVSERHFFSFSLSLCACCACCACILRLHRQGIIKPAMGKLRPVLGRTLQKAKNKSFRLFFIAPRTSPCASSGVGAAGRAAGNFSRVLLDAVWRGRCEGYENARRLFIFVFTFANLT